jgi:hypothetical protein
MQKKSMMSAVLAVAGLVGAMQSARADGCNSAEEKAAAAQMKKAEDFERAGKLKEAYGAVGKIDPLCLAGNGFKQHETMRKRIGLQLGQQEEKAGRLAAAFDWFKGSGNGAEADRVKMKQVQASPRDRNLVSGAIDHFKYKNNDARVAELRQLAAKNAELELGNEEKAFAARKESFQELGNAKDWFYYVSEGAAKKVRERAEQRGDTLAKEDTFRHLENARRYFSIAEAKSKETALKDKAMLLAQAHEKKGEITQARDFYSLAGASAKGNELQQRADAQYKKSEDKRQKQFKKGQSDLEKELGM